MASAQDQLVRSYVDSWRMSRDPSDDERIYLRLGIAMSKAQLLEVVLVKLLEAQRQDLSLPLDDRWAEISKWLDKTAGGFDSCWACRRLWQQICERSAAVVTVSRTTSGSPTAW